MGPLIVGNDIVFGGAATPLNSGVRPSEGGPVIKALAGFAVPVTTASTIAAAAR